MEQKNRVVLPYVLYGCFSIALIFRIFINDWGSWTAATVIFGMISCVGTHLLRRRDSQVDIIVFGIVVWSNLFLCFFEDSSNAILICMILVFITALSTFDMAELHYISLVCISIMLLLDMLVRTETGLGVVQDLLFVVGEYLMMFLVELVELRQLKDRKQNEKQLKKTMEDLLTAQQGKMDFMANISHEIRTPLNVICGIGSALLEENLPASTREKIYQINLSGRHLMTLVSDILDFTELENDTVEIVEEPYNLTSVINDVINMAEAWNEEKNLDIVVDCDARIPNTMIGDGQKVYRIILNLVHNAVKFTEEGGISIVIKARKAEYGINLAIEIRDTGIGIREADVEKLGSVYNQVDTRRDRKNGGIGLGLAISRKMLLKMNGFIHIDSVYGEGTTVSVVIPQKCATYEPIVSVENRQEVSILCYIDLGKYKNGYVRDAYISCIENMAEGLNVQCIRCNNFQELQRRAQKGGYNFIITAIMEYLQAREFYDSLMKKATVVVVVDGLEDIAKVTKGIRIIKKPLHVFGIAAVLNGQEAIISSSEYLARKPIFYAPHAKVLAVDDVLMNLHVVASLLKRYKIVIDIANSGMEALEKVKHTRYDLIFMDHMMPEMDGVETLHNIRRMSGEYCQTVPIVALTANAVGGAREMLLREGFDDFVAKPIEYNTMERVLKKYLAHCMMTEEEYAAECEAEVRRSGELSESGQLAKDLSEASRLPGELSESCKPSEETSDAGEAIQDEDRDIYGKLLRLKSLDAEAGMMYCGGDLESFTEILTDFISSGRKRRQKLEADLEREDFTSYKIDVHSLKGMAATVGGTQVAKLAKALQTDCETGSYEEVQRKHPQLCELLEQLLSDLESVLGTSDVLQEPVVREDVKEEMKDETGEKTENEINEETKEENIAEKAKKENIAEINEETGEDTGEPSAETAALFEELREAVSMFDQMKAMELVETLESSEAGEAVLQLAAQLHSCIDQFDFMEAERILTEAGGVGYDS